MRRLCLTLLVGFGLSAAAQAADLPVKAPMAPAVYNWSGFYIGGNVGYGWGSSDNNFLVSDPLNAGGFVGTLNATDTNHYKGVIAGGQAGYNWQSTKYVFGIETDLQGSWQKGDQNFNSAIVGTNIITGPFVNPTAITNTDKITWLGTTRGRLGYAADRWLIYATGGLAYGEVKIAGTATPATIGVIPNLPFGWSQSSTRIGWTIGAGVEAALAGKWTWKVEYLYVDLGNVTATTAIGPGCLGNPALAICGASAGGPASVSARIRDNIVRLGLNYRF